MNNFEIQMLQINVGMVRVKVNLNFFGLAVLTVYDWIRHVKDGASSTSGVLWK
jgi:hypothetical protein